MMDEGAEKEFIIYGCPMCGKTIRWTVPNSCTPSFECVHTDGVCLMKEMGFKDE